MFHTLIMRARGMMTWYDGNNLCRTVCSAGKGLRSSDANLQLFGLVVINRRIRMKPFMFCNNIKKCE
jgi:hypothetical protein